MIQVSIKRQLLSPSSHVSCLSSPLSTKNFLYLDLYKFYLNTLVLQVSVGWLCEFCVRAIVLSVLKYKEQETCMQCKQISN